MGMGGVCVSVCTDIHIRTVCEQLPIIYGQAENSPARIYILNRFLQCHVNLGKSFQSALKRLKIIKFFMLFILFYFFILKCLLKF